MQIFSIFQNACSINNLKIQPSLHGVSRLTSQLDDHQATKGIQLIVSLGNVVTVLLTHVFHKTVIAKPLRHYASKQLTVFF